MGERRGARRQDRDVHPEHGVPLGAGEDVADQRDGRDEQPRGCRPLERPQDEQGLEGRGEGGRAARQREGEQAGDEHALAADPVGDQSHDGREDDPDGEVGANEQARLGVRDGERVPEDRERGRDEGHPEGRQQRREEHHLDGARAPRYAGDGAGRDGGGQFRINYALLVHHVLLDPATSPSRAASFFRATSTRRPPTAPAGRTGRRSSRWGAPRTPRSPPPRRTRGACPSASPSPSPPTAGRPSPPGGSE